ncbi:MAG TPA: tetratricopeptide repeat protein, partial [Candidatus Acidoferrum sp.]|nr:tetratricopeptide repeat protein [Candidatus Acidoferrum sp.]
EKALSIDDTLAEPHAILAGVHNSLFEWDASEKEFRRALELNPKDATTHNWYAFMLDQTGRSNEAIAEAKRAVEVDPLNLKYSDTLGTIYRGARQYDLAITQYKNALEMDSNYAPSVNNLATTYKSMKKYDLWFEEWKKGAALQNDKEDLAIAEEASQIYAKSGYPAALRRILELELQLSKRRYVDPAGIAAYYAELGEKDQAFAWLDKAYTEKSDLLAYIKVFPELDTLLSDPRYAALLKKMGLPQ